MAVELTLPYPPSSNDLWVRTRRGLRRSDAYMEYIELCQWQSIMQGLGKKPIDGPYFLDLIATRPDKRGRDIDNIIAAPSDVLQHCGIVANDKNCGIVRATWADCPANLETVRVFLK